MTEEEIAEIAAELKRRWLGQANDSDAPSGTYGSNEYWASVRAKLARLRGELPQIVPDDDAP